MVWFISNPHPSTVRARELREAAESNRKYYKKIAPEVEQAFEDGLKAHFHATTELNAEEYKELLDFLVERNLVMCYDPYNGGFTVRKNDNFNKVKEEIYYICPDPVPIVARDYMDGGGARLVNIKEQMIQTWEFKKQDEVIQQKMKADKIAEGTR